MRALLPDIADDDPAYLGIYLRRYREMFPTRLASVTALVIATAVCASPALPLQYAVVHYALFGLFIWAVHRAGRRMGTRGTHRLLAIQSAVMSFLISCHVMWFALAVNAAFPTLYRECVLLTITILMLMGLQVHLTLWSFALSVLPPIVTLAVLARPGPGGMTAHLWGGGIFVLAVLAATLRHQRTDRQSALAAASLAVRNEQLAQALATAEAERRRAEEADRVKTDVLAVASHDIRTPLNSVLAIAEVLRAEARDPRHAELTANLHGAAGMLLRLLNGVLDFARLQGKAGPLTPEPVDLAAFMASMAAVWGPACREAGLEFRQELVGAQADFHIVTDRMRLEQIVVGLVSNAVRLSGSGDVVLTLAARTAGEDRIALTVEVLDRGPGAPAADRQRIFLPFEQTDAARGGAPGLGLASCKAAADLLGGELSIEDRPGGGSVFRFELTAPAATEAEAQTVELAPQALRVLAAEDHPANRQVLQLVLAPLGVDLEIVEDGLQAVEATRRADYDLILMDARMPVMDGPTAVSEIRAEAASAGRRRVPIHMLTANVFPDDVAHYRRAGADGVLAKPIDLKALYGCIAGLGDSGEADSGERLSA